MLTWSVVQGQNTETVNRSLQVKGKASDFWFCLCNINGSIEAEAYEGSTIELTLEKRLFERGSSSGAKVEDLQIDVIEGEDYTKVIMKHPGYTNSEPNDALDCNWNWQRKRRGGIEYDYEFNYKVKVPRGLNVKLSTVNEGHVEIKNIGGDIYASNVNGDVSIEEAKGNVKASTVNGRVDVSYASMQAEFGEFDTVNGDIYVFVPQAGSGVFSFETQWGKVYSDLDFDEKVAPKMEKVSKGGMTKYKMANSNGYRLGNGGPQLDFETLNGDIKIKRKQ